MQLSRHVRDVQNDGLEVLRRKLVRAICCGILIVNVVIALPIVVLCRLCRLFRVVRFGFFTVDRIGHFSFDVEYYLVETAVERRTKPHIDLFYFMGTPANTSFASISRRSLNVNSLVRPLYLANNLLPGGAAHRILPARELTASRDKLGLLASVPSQLAFNVEEVEMGRNYLQELGLAHDDKYVCLIIRDSKYLTETFVERDWSYHNFRDTNINDYNEAIVALVQKGYWVFRMGKVVHHPLEVKHSRVIDYATSELRCDLLDVWLTANCYFAVSTGLGLDSIADIFRRPMVFVNYLPLIDMETWGPYITVPKALTWCASGKPLNLFEQIRHSSLNGHYYNEKGIDINDLSGDQIKNAVLEMETRLSGKWLDTRADENLQKTFWDELRTHPEYSRYHGWVHPQARIGTHYLRDAKDWLFNK